jgi:hypothetical protein
MFAHRLDSVLDTLKEGHGRSAARTCGTGLDAVLPETKTQTCVQARVRLDSWSSPLRLHLGWNFPHKRLVILRPLDFDKLAAIIIGT